MRFAVTSTFFLALAAPAAGAPLFSLPLDCQLGKSCFIQQYMDHDPSKQFHDFKCGPRAYNTHKGTDFAVATAAKAKEGVNVLAAADGIVLGLRDGVPDVWSGKIDEAAIKGRDCGNGLVVDHGQGWHTQYCHMQKGSVAVSKGSVVKAGQPLGKLGMSGRTQFPHLHLSVRKDGKPIDPFAPDGATCGAEPTRTLWQDDLLFQPGGILEIGFSEKVPEYANVKQGTVDQTVNANSAALISYFYLFGGKTGDRVEMTFSGPAGMTVSDTYVLSKNRAQFFRAIGKKRRGQKWATGKYTANATLVREGEVIDARSKAFEIRN